MSTISYFRTLSHFPTIRLFLLPNFRLWLSRFPLSAPSPYSVTMSQSIAFTLLHTLCRLFHRCTLYSEFTCYCYCRLVVCTKLISMRLCSCQPVYIALWCNVCWMRKSGNSPIHMNVSIIDRQYFLRFKIFSTTSHCLVVVRFYWCSCREMVLLYRRLYIQLFILLLFYDLYIAIFFSLSSLYIY